MTTISTTPLADALASLDRIQADNTNIAGWVQANRELAALRALAEAARHHLAAAQTVYVLSYWHRHGNDISVHATYEVAANTIANIARQYWDEATSSVYALPGMPETTDRLGDEEVTRMYFMVMGNRDESYDITATSF